MIEKLDLPEEKRITMTTMREQVLMIDKLNELISSHNEALKEISILHQQNLHLVEAMAKLVSNNQT